MNPTCPGCKIHEDINVEMDESVEERAYLNDDGYRETEKNTVYECNNCGYVIDGHSHRPPTGSPMRSRGFD